jgi:hypothetical protein
VHAPSQPLNPHFGTMRLDEIQSGSVQALVGTMNAKGLSAAHDSQCTLHPSVGIGFGSQVRLSVGRFSRCRPHPAFVSKLVFSPPSKLLTAMIDTAGVNMVFPFAIWFSICRSTSTILLRLVSLDRHDRCSSLAEFSLSTKIPDQLRGTGERCHACLK